MRHHRARVTVRPNRRGRFLAKLRAPRGHGRIKVVVSSARGSGYAPVSRTVRIR